MAHVEASNIGSGLSKIRRRRWFLWAVFLTYVPAIWLSLEWTRSDSATAVVFAVWVVFAAVGGALVGFARCPRCNNYYHVKGLIPVWVRKCLHCDLSIRADKQRIGSV
jgi:hypothetical protein